VTIRHDNGLATLYGHVSGFLVQEGQRVRAGDPIALSGGTPGTKGAGRLTTGAHLHFEVYLDGKKVDPLEYLVKDERAE
jgi:murein DD-endopeptidase MepM/ murein hydrolase activator NlpD